MNVLYVLVACILLKIKQTNKQKIKGFCPMY